MSGGGPGTAAASLFDVAESAEQASDQGAINFNVSIRRYPSECAA
jgi:hypothetical protein